MKIKPIAIIDPNVIVSGFLSPFGYPGKIVDLLRSGLISAGLDDRILLEYVEILQRPKLKLNWDDVQMVLDEIIFHGTFGKPIKLEHSLVIPDFFDLPLIECAYSLQCPIVTGNTRRFPKRKFKKLTILSCKDFIESLQK